MGQVGRVLDSSTARVSSHPPSVTPRTVLQLDHSTHVDTSSVSYYLCHRYTPQRTSDPDAAVTSRSPSDVPTAPSPREPLRRTRGWPSSLGPSLPPSFLVSHLPSAMAPLLPSFLRRSSATTNPYTSLPTSSSLNLETKPTRSSSSARTNPKTLVVAFLGAQLVLICLAAVLFNGGPPTRPPHEHLEGLGPAAGPYKWGGFDEVCQGKFGEYVCGEYG